MAEQTMTEPRWIDVSAPTVQLRALIWGPEEGPIALCLYGFPDTAYGFRKLAPHLTAAGYRVIAPFMRGYVPSSLPTDRAYHLGALMDDALQVLCGEQSPDARRGDRPRLGRRRGQRAGGHAGQPISQSRADVGTALGSAERPAAARGALLRLLPGQLLRSWYIGYFQLPFAPERSGIVDRAAAWRRWSPGYGARRGSA